MTKQQRQILLLGVLSAVAVVAFVVPMLDGPAETVQPPSNLQGGAGAAAPDAPVVDLDLERLAREREPLPESRRDPFRFLPVAPPPAPARSATTRPAPRAEDLPPPLPIGPPQPPPPPPIPVKFFGLVELRGGVRVAAFTDTRGNTFYGKEGDIIEGRYRLLRISADSVELAYLDGRGRQTIRLTGQ